MIGLSAATALAFDLLCSGTTEKYDVVARHEPIPFERNIHIDLRRKLWCEDECESVLPIAEVQPTVLILKDTHGVLTDGTDYTIGALIDRTDGSYSAHDSMTRSDGRLLQSIRTKAACELRPFTGFPSPPPPPRTKF